MADRDEGSGTAALLAVSGVIVLLLFTLLLTGQLRWAGSAAQTAADVAALAAADVARGLATGDACDVAARMAEVNAARLTSCAVDGEEATVTVTVSVLERADAAGRGLTVERTARAGPPSR